MRTCRVATSILTLLVCCAFSSSAAATLIGDTVGACVLDFDACVIDSTPGANENGVLNQDLAIVGGGTEFDYRPNGTFLVFEADFDEASPLVGSLLLTITNNGVIPIATGRTDTGWVFTGFDREITDVVFLGGELGIQGAPDGFFWESDTMGVNFDPWSLGVQCCGDHIQTASFEIHFLPEPSTGLLLSFGLIGLVRTRMARLDSARGAG